MQILVYNFFLFLYHLAIRIASLFNNKAKNWLRGRKDIIQIIKSSLPHDEERIWMHCSSLGEFEQGRPLLEAIHKQYPQYRIVLTFFSPSGYLIRKNYELADYVFYLPLDGWRTSAKFVRAVNPSLAIFVKYEFWYYYLCNLNYYKIPVILVAASFRKSQHFFKWYGGFFRKILKTFDFIFVQDAHSQKLLSLIHIKENVIIAGDTRYDRVSEISKTALELPLIELFKEDKKLLIAGSTWIEDDKILCESFKTVSENWKLIIAPHEIGKSNIKKIQELYGDEAVLYSQLSDLKEAKYRVLVIDNIGMLSSLYSYGEISYIGGGFKKGGIHNTLEPAVFGLPVIFGPEYEKFVEAVELVREGFGFPVNNVLELNETLSKLCSDYEKPGITRNKLKDYMTSKIGATEIVMDKVSDIL